MFSLSKSASLAMAVAALCAVGNAMATPVAITGEGTEVDQTGAKTAQAQFSKLLQPGTTTESFQVGNGGFTEGQQPSFSIFAGASTLKLTNGDSSPDGDTDIVTAQSCQFGVCSGRYDMTGKPGSGWFETQDSFEFLLGTGHDFSAFGFYVTDLSDFGADLSLQLLNADGSVATTLLVSKASPPPAGWGGAPVNDNGSLIFYGFTDTARQYSGIRFSIAQTQSGDNIDVMGFDELVFGNVAVQQGLPEPTSLALAGLAMLGAGAAARRQRKA